MKSVDEMQQEHAAAIAEAKVPTEQELRAETVPWLGSTEELIDYINRLTDRPHDYGTCAYATSMAAVAAFQYVAKKLGITGFQASCADLDVLRRTRGYAGPFAVFDAENLVYPQYDLLDKMRKCIEEWEPWAAEQARQKLADKDLEHVHPDVLAHWQRLARIHPPKPRSKHDEQ